MYTKDQITSAIWEELKEAQHTGDNNDRVYEVIGIVTAALERIKQPSLPPLPEPILTDKDVKDWGDTKEFIDRGGIWQARAEAAEKELQKLKTRAGAAHIHKDTVEENWESFWKPIVTNEDGTINIEQIKKELHDFSFIMEQVPKVYCHITGNRMSKVMYHADTVISVADDYFQEQLDEAVKDEKGETSAPLTQSRADLIREANNRDLEGVAGTISQDAHEKEVMMQTFNKVRQIFEGRQWIVEGRGSYPYNDDRYKEEVRYMYDEFDALQKDTWKNIESRSIEYRKAIIKEHVKGTAAWKEEAIQRIKDFSLSDVDAPVFTHTREFAAHFSYIKGKLMDIIRAEGTGRGEMSDDIKQVIAAFVKVARHIRNYPHPQLTIELLRAEAVIAESKGERILGRNTYDEISELAFKQKEK